MTLAFLCLYSCPCSVLNSLYCVPVHYFSFQFYWKPLFSTLYSLELNLYIDFTSLTTFSMDFSFSSAYSCLTSAHFCFTVSFLYKNHSFYLLMGPKTSFLYVVYRLLRSDLIFVGSVSCLSLPHLILPSSLFFRVNSAPRSWAPHGRLKSLPVPWLYWGVYQLDFWGSEWSGKIQTSFHR